jgi:hypothetical protein
VKIRFGKVGYPLYCDAGPYEGEMRIDLNIKLYLSPEEYARYEGSESLQITLQDNGDGRPGTSNTAEPSGELQVADLVVAGEAAQTVERAGIRKVRIDEHGTHPLPAPADGQPAGAGQGDGA